LRAGLAEDIKWGKPCYSHDGKNIAIMQEMKNSLALMFFKGALLDDPAGVLHAQGPNSRSARRLEFTSVADVKRMGGALKSLLAEAITVEESGANVGPAPELVLVEELQNRLDRNNKLRIAFEALTPGRRREYNLHIGDAKQAASLASTSVCPRSSPARASATARPSTSPRDSPLRAHPGSRRTHSRKPSPRQPRSS